MTVNGTPQYNNFTDNSFSATQSPQPLTNTYSSPTTPGSSQPTPTSPYSPYSPAQGSSGSPSYPTSNKVPARDQQQVPDAIVNMASKGSPDKKPWAYAPDMNSIQQQREKVRRR